MKMWTRYSLTTGALGEVLTIPHDDLILGAQYREGWGLIEGCHDGRTHCVDIQTGDLIERLPPCPPATEDHTWRWDPARLRYVAQRTPARIAADARAELLAVVTKLEAQQARSLRALALDPNDQQARQRLSEIEAQIAATGIRGPTERS